MMDQQLTDEAKELIAELQKQLSKSTKDQDKVLNKLIKEIKRIDGGQGSEDDYQATARRILKITQS